MLTAQCSLVLADEIGLRYQNGLSAYQNGQFDLAVQEFESILAADWTSPELLYNLGNAYYRDGFIAGAVWAYEECLLHDPGHRDAQYNLKLANVKVIDRIDIPDPPFYLKAYRQLKQSLTPDSWIFTVSVLLLSISILFALNRLTGMKWLMKLNSAVIPVSLAALLISIHSVNDQLRINEGVIYRKVVSAYSEPNEFSTRLFDVHAGLKVAVLNQSDNWTEIELLDGKTGWIDRSEIRLLED